MHIRKVIFPCPGRYLPGRSPLPLPSQAYIYLYVCRLLEARISISSESQIISLRKMSAFWQISEHCQQTLIFPGLYVTLKISSWAQEDGNSYLSIDASAKGGQYHKPFYSRQIIKGNLLPNRRAPGVVLH